MIEKPNKDGKTQTIEYQEEEILVSVKSPKKISIYSFSQRFIDDFVTTYPNQE